MMTFETSRWFRDLPGPLLQRLAAHAQERSFRAGHSIFREGDPADGIYLLKSGQAEISRLAGREHQVFALIAPGDVFGEMAGLDGLPRSAFASASVDSVVYFLPRESLLRTLTESPELAAKFLREISVRLQAFNRRYSSELAQVLTQGVVETR